MNEMREGVTGRTLIFGWEKDKSVRQINAVQFEPFVLLNKVLLCCFPQDFRHVSEALLDLKIYKIDFPTQAIFFSMNC